jgi:putative transposase
MPRREVRFQPEMYYHVYNRGNNRQKVFFEAENYLFFLRRFEKYLSPVTTTIAYCLMPTHYHILVRIKTYDGHTSEVSETSDVSIQISRAMQKFLISYTKAINKRFGRVGALFQGQFQAKPIRRYSHLLAACVYIHANPVKDGLVDLPEDWPHSNYSEWLGYRERRVFDYEFIREHFGSPEEYRTLVMNYIRTRSLVEKANTDPQFRGAELKFHRH